MSATWYKAVIICSENFAVTYGFGILKDIMVIGVVALECIYVKYNSRYLGNSSKLLSLKQVITFMNIYPGSELSG